MKEIRASGRKVPFSDGIFPPLAEISPPGYTAPMDYSNWKLWFSAEGRINRRPYFFAGLAASCFIEGHKLVPEALQILYLPLLLVAAYAALVLGIKRCHDRDKTGWFMLVNFIPLLQLWPMIDLTFFKGTEGPNQYGPDPLAPDAAPQPPAQVSAPPA